MHTLSLHLPALATLLGARTLSDSSPSVPSAALGRATGGMTFVIFVLLITFVAGMTHAARGVAALIAQFLRVAAVMTSVLLTILIAIAIIVAMLIQQH
jgi:hypothetical protein